MTKKKTMKNIKTPNKFNTGGITVEGALDRLNTPPTLKIDYTQLAPIPEKDTTGIYAKAYTRKYGKPAAGLLGGLAGGLISDGFSTTGGQLLSGIGDAAMAFNPLIGGAIKLASGIVNKGFGTKWDQAGIAEAENQIVGLNTFQSGASDFDTLAQDFSRIGSMNKTIKASDLGEDGWFVNRTQTKANKLNTDLGNAYNYAMRNINNVADNISNNTLANLERNYTAFGGPLFAYGGQTHGADFTNGLMFINNGGTHESNPYEGVPISIDQEGNPNLVEEGEVIWNNYVFSNRLKVPKSIQKKYKLGKREMTFANAIDKLSKESEERPNDPISMRGLENVLMNMAIEQETIKSKKQPKNTEKNKFPEGGTWDWLSFINGVKGYTLSNRRGNTPGTYAIAPYENGDIKDLENSEEYQQFTNYVLNNSTNEDVLNYLRALDAATPNTVEKLFGADGKLKSNWNNIYTGRRNDGLNGVYHLTGGKNFLDYLNTLTEEPTLQPVTANRYFIKNADGTVTQMTDNLPFEGLNTEGRTWAELNPNYVFAGKQVREPEDINGVPTTYTDYYYDPKVESTPTEVPYEQLPTWMRYAPAVGFGALALSDTLGITNKPDYSNADAIIKATRDKATYDPIRFKPIGDYLAYNPFDTEYHANQLRAVAGANRRNIMNTSGGNRAAAMAGILASDNNTMNQLGDLYRKASEYNLEQRQKVADFNRATNITNSEGFYRADAANQSAALQARGLGLEGLMRGYTMKEQAKLMSDQARAANLSGLFTNLGNIGYENANRNMANWSIANGTWAPSQWAYNPLTGKPIKSNQ